MALQVYLPDCSPGSRPTEGRTQPTTEPGWPWGQHLPVLGLDAGQGRSRPPWSRCRAACWQWGRPACLLGFRRVGRPARSPHPELGRLARPARAPPHLGAQPPAAAQERAVRSRAVPRPARQAAHQRRHYPPALRCPALERLLPRPALPHRPAAVPVRRCLRQAQPCPAGTPPSSHPARLPLPRPFQPPCPPAHPRQPPASGHPWQVLPAPGPLPPGPEAVPGPATPEPATPRRCQPWAGPAQPGRCHPLCCPCVPGCPACPQASRRCPEPEAVRSARTRLPWDRGGLDRAGQASAARRHPARSRPLLPTQTPPGPSRPALAASACLPQPGCPACLWASPWCPAPETVRSARTRLPRDRSGPDRSRPGSEAHRHPARSRRPVLEKMQPEQIQPEQTQPAPSHPALAAAARLP